MVSTATTYKSSIAAKKEGFLYGTSNCQLKRAPLCGNCLVKTAHPRNAVYLVTRYLHKGGHGPLADGAGNHRSEGEYHSFHSKVAETRCHGRCWCVIASFDSWFFIIFGQSISGKTPPYSGHSPLFNDPVSNHSCQIQGCTFSTMVPASPTWLVFWIDQISLDYCLFSLHSEPASILFASWPCVSLILNDSQIIKLCVSANTSGHLDTIWKSIWEKWPVWRAIPKSE